LAPGRLDVNVLANLGFAVASGVYEQHLRGRGVRGRAMRGLGSPHATERRVSTRQASELATRSCGARTGPRMFRRMGSATALGAHAAAFGASSP
jgi:hypothetical protein